MSLGALQPGGLYVILFIRDDPPAKDDFHWGLYVHKNKDDGGTKYHITDQRGLNLWTPEHGTTSGVFKSICLVGLLQIARVPTGWEAHVDKQLCSYDDSLNDRPASIATFGSSGCLNCYRSLTMDKPFLNASICGH